MGKSKQSEQQDVFRDIENDSEIVKLNGLISSENDDDESEDIENYCDDFALPPFCGCCGTEMRFSIAKLKFKCPQCGHTMYLDEYALNGDDNNDYEEYYQKPDDDIPECCKACGGPYPNCRSSCKIFDD